MTTANLYHLELLPFKNFATWVECFDFPNCEVTGFGQEEHVYREALEESVLQYEASTGLKVPFTEVPLDVVSHISFDVEYWDGTESKIKVMTWSKDGKKHRLGGPAIIVPGEHWVNEWWMNGELHRFDGPAVEDYNEYEEWWVNGKLHRENGPAIFESSDDSNEWWINGKLHREDGPAYTDRFGSSEWWFEGKKHRVDGPAITSYDNIEEWWVNGKRHREGKPAVVDKASPEDDQWWFEGVRVG
jgi:hypothetical protein